MRAVYATLVIVASVLAVSMAAYGSASPLVVSANDGALTSIQDAIDTAETGGIVVIRSGTYKENLLIDRPVTLIGEDGAIIVPEDPSQPAIAVRETEGIFLQGLTILDAVVGIELTNSSCAILDCVIRASGIGVDSVAFQGTTVLLNHVEFRGSSTGTGMALLGMGLTLLADCEFDLFGTGASLGGTVCAVIRACSFKRCFDGLAILDTATVTLLGNTVRDNHGSGIGLSRNPEQVPDGRLLLLENTFEQNGDWGISLCGFDALEPDIRFGRIEGAENAFRGNGRGRTCPEDLALPAGFFLEE